METLNIDPKMALRFLTGSRMYGLETPESDYDYHTIFFDLEDLLLPEPFRQFKNTVEINGKNDKYTNFPRFLELLYKGNPNAVELCVENPETPIEYRVQRFMRESMVVLRLSLLTENYIKAYIGHLVSVDQEYGRGKIPDLKRLSHCVRCYHTAKNSLLYGAVRPFSEMKNARSEALAVKIGLKILEHHEISMMSQELMELLKENQKVLIPQDELRKDILHVQRQLVKLIKNPLL